MLVTFSLFLFLTWEILDFFVCLPVVSKPIWEIVGISMSINPNYLRKNLLRSTFLLYNHNVILTLRKFNID